jgi:hypothetical protein
MYAKTALGSSHSTNRHRVIDHGPVTRKCSREAFSERSDGVKKNVRFVPGLGERVGGNAGGNERRRSFRVTASAAVTVAVALVVPVVVMVGLQRATPLVGTMVAGTVLFVALRLVLEFAALVRGRARLHQ